MPNLSKFYHHKKTCNFIDFSRFNDYFFMWGNIWKKFVLLLSIILFAFCFTSCPNSQVINEPSYEYTIELNIKNESSSQKSDFADGIKISVSHSL